jgi:predicted N-acetyltransferase YhbS
MAQATSAKADRITLREAKPSDADELARICFEAFGGIHDYHRFQRDFPTLEAAAGMLGLWIPHPKVWGVVAEIDGRIVGSNFLDERDPIPGVGPITVDPEGQNAGVGRRLMEAVIERGKDAPSIRLVQDAFHMRSLSLYASLGFEVTASCVVMTGKLRDDAPSDVEVRPVAEDDVEACEALHQRVHGFTRTGTLRDAMAGPFAPFAAIRDGRITAYATSVNFWPMACGVADSEEDMEALLLGAGAASDEPLAVLVPLRSGLFRWSLDQGLRAFKPMNVMTRGEYREPEGAWFTSVLY